MKMCNMFLTNILSKNSTSDEETVSSDDFNEDYISENVFANLLLGWVCKINVLGIALISF